MRHCIRESDFVLIVEDLCVSYEDNKVLKNFELTINQSEIVAIVGESGSGKSTAIRAIFSLLSNKGKITEGNIVFEGESLIDKSDNEWNCIRGKKISMVFQDSGAMLSPIRKIKSQLIEYVRIHSNMSKKEAYKKCINMLRSTNLTDPERVMNSYPFQLSGGMKQRVGIAIAMMFKPKLLLADEPTSALDATTQKQIVEEMMNLRDKDGTSIVIVTHNLGVAAYMADKIIVMKDGKIIEVGSATNVINMPKHKYTKELINTVPDLERREKCLC